MLVAAGQLRQQFGLLQPAAQDEVQGSRVLSSERHFIPQNRILLLGEGRPHNFRHPSATGPVAFEGKDHSRKGGGSEEGADSHNG